MSKAFVVVRLCGGLGNQMFQYAAGRALAHRLKAQLELDITGFGTDPLRQYGLKHLSIKEQFAAPEEIQRFFVSGESHGVCSSALLQRLGLRQSYSVLKENLSLPFVPDILTIKGNVYLEGYWQSEKYFSDIKEILRTEFTVRSELNRDNEQMLDLISRTNAVCIHVRRGDYVTNPDTNRVHGTCPVDYYVRGTNIIKDRFSNPHFFLFSDDPQWAAENVLPLAGSVTHVFHNSADDVHEDLRLMYHCKHFIIANSSLSWWAAWLSQNPEKTVLAPERWLNDTSYDRKDLIPDKWEKI